MTMAKLTDLSKIHPQVLADLRERHCDAALEIMSAAELFNEWCERNGIIGYAYTILATIDNLREAAFRHEASKTPTAARTYLEFNGLD